MSGASDEAVIAVVDEGPGIAVSDMGRVFAPFFRTEDARRRGVVGLGLGLSVADRVVRALGGRIELQSASNSGSSFTIWLPIHRDIKVDDGGNGPRHVGE